MCGFLVSALMKMLVRENDRYPVPALDKAFTLPTRIPRLGRFLTHLLAIVTDLMTRQVGLKSLNGPIDTTTPQGRLILNLFASPAEFEREVIRERTPAGLLAARARGRTGGLPKGLPRKAEATACAAESLYREGRLSARDIADELHISKRTLSAPTCRRGKTVGV